MTKGEKMTNKCLTFREALEAMGQKGSIRYCGKSKGWIVSDKISLKYN